MHDATNEVRHVTTDELMAGLDEIRRSPKDEGILALIVRRPAIDAREILERAALDLQEGLVGDSWSLRGSSRSIDGGPHPLMQLNVMNARAVALVAQSPLRWPLAGDQLFVDLDLSGANLPPGTRLSIGSAVIEVTPEPHTGCVKFMSRFGKDAHRFVNTKPYRNLRLRGLNAKVIEPGTVSSGDTIRKL